MQTRAAQLAAFDRLLTMFPALDAEEQKLVRERLVELFPSATKPTGRITAVHLRGHELGPAARFVLEFVAQHIRDAVLPLPIP